MRNPFFSALALIGNLGSLAVLYLLLSAEFVAAAQVLVYAGAVMVMFLFVIAYLGGQADAPFAGHREHGSAAARRLPYGSRPQRRQRHSDISRNRWAVEEFSRGRPRYPRGLCAGSPPRLGMV